MHVDHIIPSKPEGLSEDVKQYINRLCEDGFVPDSIENYLPVCSKCNIEKSNHEYTVTGLVFLHEEAARHVSEILDYMKTIEADYDEEPISDVWEELSYSQQKDSIINALLCSRLTPSDVEACPELPQVKRIIDRLELSNSVVVEGKPGSGKSISSYQVGYHYKKKGWYVYRLKASQHDYAKIPNVVDKSVFLIDDAQNYSQESQNQWVESARDEVKVIITKTISDDTPIDSIIISNNDSIAVMKQSLINDRDNATYLVHKLDNNIGDHFGGIPIERRINEASAAKTPWEFNYILTGGWNRVRAQYEELREDNSSGLLACLIAVMQILQKDNSVDLSLLNKYSKIVFNKSWSFSVVNYLVKKRVVFSEQDIRIIHIQSAYVIVSIFLNRSKRPAIEQLRSFIELYIIENDLSPLGLVWFFNGLLSYTYLPLEQLFLTDVLINHYFSDLNKYRDSEEKRNIAWLASKAIHQDLPISLRSYLISQKEILIQWFYEVDNVNVYAFSVIINDAINNKDLEVLSWCSRIDWDRLCSRFEDLETIDYISWGHLFNRLFYVSYCTKTQLPADYLIRIMKYVSEVGPRNDLYSFFNFFTNFAVEVPEYTFFVLHKHLDLLKNAFMFDTKLIFQVLDFDFLTYFCGMGFLDKPNPTDFQRRFSLDLLSILPIPNMSNYISNSYSGEWHSFLYILGYIEYYNKNMLKEIGRSIDIDALSLRAENCWDSYHEINDILRILQASNINNAKNFLKLNDNHIKNTSPLMSVIHPRLMLSLFKKGCYISVVDNESSFYYSYYALKRLNEADPNATKTIIKDNIDNIVKVLNVGTALHFDDNYCLKYLELLSTIETESYHMIITKLDKDAIKTMWDRCGGLRSSNRTMKKRQKKYFKMIGIE